MIRVTQTVFGADGNCLPACVASILELDIAEVPNFCAGQFDGSWLRRMADWLAERGFSAVHVSVGDRDPGATHDPEGLAIIAEWLKTRRVGLAIVSGYTARGRSHSTVWRDGDLVHDPHPSQDPLLNVVDIIVISPRDPVRAWLAGGVRTISTAHEKAIGDVRAGDVGIFAGDLIMATGPVAEGRVPVLVLRTGEPDTLLASTFRWVGRVSSCVDDLHEMAVYISNLNSQTGERLAALWDAIGRENGQRGDWDEAIRVVGELQEETER